ncbi:hypothetical protein ACFLYA_00855 [Candidatus Dependentiae bacterium]
MNKIINKKTVLAAILLLSAFCIKTRKIMSAEMQEAFIARLMERKQMLTNQLEKTRTLESFIAERKNILTKELQKVENDLVFYKGLKGLKTEKIPAPPRPTPGPKPVPAPVPPQVEKPMPTPTPAPTEKVEHIKLSKQIKKYITILARLKRELEIAKEGQRKELEEKIKSLDAHIKTYILNKGIGKIGELQSFLDVTSDRKQRIALKRKGEAIAKEISEKTGHQVTVTWDPFNIQVTKEQVIIKR